MKYKCKYFIVDGRFLHIIVKKPLFGRIKKILSYYDYKFKTNDEKCLGCAISKKGEIIITFVLRDFEKDIKPYIENENRKENR